MGYDVFITRATHHYEGAQTPIAKGDWRALIENDPDLHAPDDALPCYAVWSGPSGLDKPWIDWAGGNLFTRSPDEAVLRKLIELAELLGARVQGREGEVYRLEGDKVTWNREPRRDPPTGSPTLRTSELANLLEEASSPGDAGPPAPLSSEKLFGPRPRRADGQGGSGPDDVHADASFARTPSEVIGSTPAPGAIPEPPFRVGQRVMTSWGRPATVVSIDPRADGGVGHIEIRYDDGRVATTSCLYHRLEAIEV